MTDELIRELGPAFSAELSRYRSCLLQKRTAGHFGKYCLGLLADLPRKSVEPMALAAGATVRTMQEFLGAADWDEDRRPVAAGRRVPAAGEGGEGAAVQTGPGDGAAAPKSGSRVHP